MHELAAKLKSLAIFPLSVAYGIDFVQAQEMSMCTW